MPDLSKRFKYFPSPLCDIEQEYPSGNPVRINKAYFEELKALVPETNAWYSKRDKKPKVVNSVAKTSFMCDIDLKALCGLIQCVDYKPTQFAAAIIRIWPPRNSILLFPNGNVVVTGTDSIETARTCVQNLRLKLYEVGIVTELACMKMSNIVYNAKVDHRISLDNLDLLYGTKTSYEPERFAGLVFRISLSDLDLPQEGSKARNITVLIFEEGKIIIMGVKEEEELVKTFDYIKDQVYVCIDKRERDPTAPKFESRISNKSKKVDGSKVLGKDVINRIAKSRDNKSKANRDSNHNKKADKENESDLLPISQRELLYLEQVSREMGECLKGPDMPNPNIDTIKISSNGTQKMSTANEDNSKKQRVLLDMPVFFS